MSSSAPFLHSPTLFHYLFALFFYSSSSRFLVREITRRIYHIYFYIFESFIIFFSCVPSFTQTPFSSARYFLLPHVCFPPGFRYYCCCFCFYFCIGCRVDTLHCHSGVREHTPNPDHVPSKLKKSSYFHHSELGASE